MLKQQSLAEQRLSYRAMKVCAELLITFFFFLSADGGRNLSLDSISMGLPMSDPTAWATAMNNLGMAPMGMTGQPLLPGVRLYPDCAHLFFPTCLWEEPVSAELD